MKNFQNWLKEKKGITQGSIYRHQNNINLIQNWIEKEQLNIENITYAEATKYIEFLQAENITPQSINNRLNSLSHYMDFQVDEGNIMFNPIKTLRVKNVQQKIKNILPQKDMDELYTNYPSQRPEQLRDKIIIGLMIYQAADTGTLKALKTKDVQLERGSIHLPARRRSNSRNLPLQPNQIITLNRYLQDIRPHLKENSEALFTNNIHNMMFYLLKRIIKLNPNILHARQFRASRIVHWLKQHNIREVQYFAGHRSITSTEAYLQHDVEELRRTLGDFHPLG